MTLCWLCQWPLQSTEDTSHLDPITRYHVTNTLSRILFLVASECSVLCLWCVMLSLLLQCLPTVGAGLWLQWRAQQHWTAVVTLNNTSHGQPVKQQCCCDQCSACSTPLTLACQSGCTVHTHQTPRPLRSRVSSLSSLFTLAAAAACWQLSLVGVWIMIVGTDGW